VPTTVVVVAALRLGAEADPGPRCDLYQQLNGGLETMSAERHDGDNINLNIGGSVEKGAQIAAGRNNNQTYWGAATSSSVMADGGDAPRRVFLSHSSELRRFPVGGSYIAAAQEAVTRVGDAVTDMGYFGARDATPAQVCRDQVTRADVLVVVAGFRYGSPVLDEPELSYTELEFNTATNVGLPRLVFLLEPDAVGPDDLFSDPEWGQRQERFRRRLRGSGLTTASVRNPQQLELAIYQALHELLHVRGAARRGSAVQP
jgi:hypothetical protein